MASLKSGPHRPGIALESAIVSVLLFAGLGVDALSAQYCSNLNTGASFNAVTNIYQSNGACYQTCDSSWAFAIVQGNSCWCSNYAPGVTTSGGDCSQPCPGFPMEKCGSSDAGLYGYISLDVSVSGTIGAPSSTSNPTSSGNSQSQTQSTTLISTTSSPSSPSSSSPSSSSASTWSPTPVITVQTITGQVQTVTITPTEPPTPTATAASVAPTPSYHRSAGLSKGSVAGLVIGLLAAIALSSILVFFCLRRRQDSMSSLASGDGSNRSRSPPQSRGSMHGLLGNMSEKQPSSGRPSIRLWPDPRAKTNSEIPENFMPVARVPSNPRLVDQRLDPGTLWNVENDTSSRASVRSLRDDRDYSRRVLKLANPDDGSSTHA